MTPMSDFFERMTEYQNSDAEIYDTPATPLAEAFNTETMQKDEISKYGANYWQSINNDGFIIYNHPSGSLCLRKMATPSNPKELNEEIYLSMDAVAERISSFLSQVDKQKFLVTAAYNVGFGSEYVDCIVESLTQDGAITIALDIFANKHHLDINNIEIKIRPSS